MNAKSIFLLGIALLIAMAGKAQITEVKHVACNGGSIKEGPGFTSLSVAGELAAGRFSASTLTGTFGYLDEDASLTGINTATIQPDNILIYPNPNNGSFVVSVYCDKPATVELKLCNLLGSTYQQRKAVLSAAENKFVFFDQPAGVWFITLEMDGIKETRKVVVVK